MEELARHCNTDNQRHGDEDNDDNQPPGAEGTCKSRDHENAFDTTAEASTSNSSTTTTPSQLEEAPRLPQPCGVKATSVKQTAAAASDKADTKRRPNSGTGTLTRTKKLQEARWRRPSDAITDITHAKTLTHRAVLTHKEKTEVQSGDSKVNARRQSRVQPAAAAATSGTPSKPVKTQQSTEREGSGRGSRAKPASSSENQTRRPGTAGHSKQKHEDKRVDSPAPSPADDQKSSQAEIKVVVQTKPVAGAVPALAATTTTPQTDNSTPSKPIKTQQSTEREGSGRGSRAKPASSSEKQRPGTADHSKKEHKNKPVDNKAPSPADDQKSSQPEITVAVQSKSDTGEVPPTSNVNQKSKSTKAEKNEPRKVETPEPTAARSDEDDDEEWDWTNLISALRDPDDIRHRQTEPRRSSNWNVRANKPGKPAKEGKAEGDAADGDEEEEEEEV